jgi:hypothetical protein
MTIDEKLMRKWWDLRISGILYLYSCCAGVKLLKNSAFLKVFRPLDFLNILLGYSLVLNCIFFLINLHTIPRNDKAKTAFLEMFANVLKIRSGNFRPFTQYFVEAPSAAITASSLLGFDATSLAHLYLRSISHSSLQILSSSVRSDEECHCRAIFRSLQRCSIGFFLQFLLLANVKSMTYMED